MDTTEAYQAVSDGSSGQRLVRQFKIKARGCSAMEAFYYAMKVAQQGEISETSRGKQHCFHTSFTNGTEVSVIKSEAGIETFNITKPSGE